MVDTLPIYYTMDVLGFYQQQKAEFHFQQKTDNEFLMFLLDTAVRVISIVQQLAPVIEAVSEASKDDAGNDLCEQEGQVQQLAPVLEAVSEASKDDADNDMCDQEGQVQHLVPVIDAVSEASKDDADNDLCEQEEQGYDFSTLMTDNEDTTFYSWREWSTACAGDETTVCMVSPSVVIPNTILKLSDTDLRNELIAKGAHPGPITSGTKKVYQEYLVKLQTAPINLDDSLEGYPKELVSCLRGQPQADWSESELAMVKEFQSPVLGRTYRQGTKKYHFNYLLLDPRIAGDLPKLSETLHPVQAFQRFVKSVFYVGKGKQSRPYGHLFEASQKVKDNAKVRKIRNIWSCGRGVMSLHVFSNTIAEEAFTREGVMIAAIGMKKLSNEKQGEIYGVSKTWSPAKRRGVGVALLYKAYLTLLNEGHREIRENEFR